MSEAAPPAPQAPTPPVQQQPAPQAKPVAHNPANEPGRTTPIHRPGLHQRPNVWEWKATDADGAQVEFAPGKTRQVFRGPTTPNDAKRLANLYLVNARNDAIRAGYPDPGYKLDEASVKPVGQAGDAGDDLGEWRPDGAVPITLGVGLTEPNPDAGK